MCEVDFDGDTPAVWDRTWRTARKTHGCTSCGRTIQAGERYCQHFSVHDGSVYAEKMCGGCARASDSFAAAHNGMSYVPSYLAQSLADCIADGDEESERVWSPLLQRLEEQWVTATELVELGQLDLGGGG